MYPRAVPTGESPRVTMVADAAVTGPRPQQRRNRRRRSLREMTDHARFTFDRFLLSTLSDFQSRMFVDQLFHEEGRSVDAKATPKRRRAGAAADRLAAGHGLSKSAVRFVYINIAETPACPHDPLSINTRLNALFLTI